MMDSKVISWVPGYRIIPTRFPSVYLYDRVASSEEFDALYELEAMTNDRLRDENGDLSLIAQEDRVFGPGTGAIMAAFTHLNPAGSRFSDGRLGVFYASKEKETAIAETRFHSENFLKATNTPPIYLQMRLYQMHILGSVTDLVRYSEDNPEILSKTSYGASQSLAKSLRENGSNGLLYPSVRNESGLCVAAFKPKILSNCFHAAYLEYHWNGFSINYETEKIN